MISDAEASSDVWQDLRDLMEQYAFGALAALRCLLCLLDAACQVDRYSQSVSIEENTTRQKERKGLYFWTGFRTKCLLAVNG